MVIVFDLDDTLYDETEYVKSGFRQVARHLNITYAIDEHQAYSQMLDILKQKGRGNIFNEVLAAHGLLSKKHVRDCLSVYRLHHPQISLPESAVQCLFRFKDYPTYIVTDGNKLVQFRKVQALGLFGKVKKVFITHRYGIDKSKPSPYCFLKIQQLEKTTPDNILYIGDNAKKDFIGIKPLGFKTIRVRTGSYSEDWYSEAHEAHVIIDSLDELTPALINSL
jgi:putative hydrolase of the HAD superfamily